MTKERSIGIAAKAWPRLEFQVRLLSWATAAFLACSLVASSALAQAPLSDFVFTVGTSAHSGANDYAYLLLDSVTPGLLDGKRFAVYGKAGTPETPGTFSQRGLLFQHADPTEIDALLSQSVALGQNLGALNDSLGLLLRKVPGSDTQTLPQKVVSAFGVARTNSQTAAFLQLYAHSNPGLSLAMGRAFAEQISGLTTYEIREINPADASVGDVVGRVTIDNAAPLVLPAPGAPFQVVTNDPADNLRIRLRWGVPDELRRLSLARFGYNVWRIAKAAGEAAGYHLTPPSLSQLLGDASFVRVNHAPVQATKDFNAGSGPGAADDPADRVTHFFTDDNNGTEPGGVPFVDGEEFYYFITARDILARDGSPSPAGLGRACLRIPPSAPRSTVVTDEPLVMADGQTQQRLRITWTQPPVTNGVVSEFWVYRWPNPSMAFTNDFAPLSNRVGVVSAVAGTNTQSFLDNGADSPTVPGLGVYWYTVRAVQLAACDPLLSPHSPPASAVLRERSGPEATTGSVLGSCGAPAVIYTGFDRDLNTNRLASRNYYRLVCERRDKGIAWAQFIITNSFSQVEVLSPIYFASDSDVLDFEYGTEAERSDRYVTAVGCIVGTGPENSSPPAIATFESAPPVQQRWHANFQAGTVLLTAANPADPIVASLNRRYRGMACFPAVNPEVDAGETVSMFFDLNTPRPPVMVQANTNGPNSTNWFNVGLAVPDTNGIYSVSYPACAYGPLPLFRGCVVELPAEADCPQHLTGNSGPDGNVAPLIVKFRLTPRTREYRLYKQIDDGELTLISQGAATYNPARPDAQLTIPDDTMPPSAARLCYYAQLLDEHGNPSPMASLGCKEAGPAVPPKPVLAEPIPAGTNSRPQVTLNWFCPTSGVSRFQVMIKRLSDNGSGNSAFNSPLLQKVKVFEAVQPSLFQLKVNGILKISDITGIQYTPKLSAGFGPGPQFTLTADVLANVPYEITIASVNSTGDRFTSSETWPFTWTPPSPRVTVPWPARPLPAVEPFDQLAPGSSESDYAPRVSALLFTNAVTGQLQDAIYPIGIRIGELPHQMEPQANVGNGEFVRFFAGRAPAAADPNQYIFRKRDRNPARAGAPLLPIVVYRQQVTNASFPKVSGDLVQVTPLIERIAWSVDPNFTVTIPDRLIAVRDETYNNAYFSLVYLRDQQPVIRNARYRYSVVRFNDKHEIDDVIPAGEVEISYKP